MSDLPDLNETQISVIAYWNATDHGVDSIDPSDVTSWGNITNQTVYDNGLEGEYDLGEPSSKTYFRVKNDGWIITWSERGENYQQRVRDDNSWAQGIYSLAWNWYGYKEHNADNATKWSVNVLPRGIQGLQSQLQNSASITFNYGDVGHYSYEHPDATAVSAFNVWGEYENMTGSFNYTEGTDLHYLVAAGGASNWDSHSAATFEGQTLAAASGDYHEYGALDPEPLGLIADPGVDMQIQATAGDTNGEWSHSGVVALWG